MLTVWIPGTPKGQPRPRAFARGGKARVFDPGTAEGWKSAIAYAVRDSLAVESHDLPFSGPVHVTLKCWFPRPKSHYTKKGLRREAPTYHTAKPDSDNVLKAALDALTQIGVWTDDSQVCSLEVVKFYADETDHRLKVGAWLEVGRP